MHLSTQHFLITHILHFFFTQHDINILQTTMPSDSADENDSSVGQKRQGALQVGPRKKAYVSTPAIAFYRSMRSCSKTVVVQILLSITADILGVLFML